MSKDRRIFLGNVAFTFTRGPKSTTFTVQARLEAQRLTIGTTEQPLEAWQATVTRRIIATSGFETRNFDDTPIITTCELDMRAGTEAWIEGVRDVVLPEVYLKKTLKFYKRKLRAQKAKYERGNIWEERV